MKRQNYPFTAIVGQERMKKALLLNAINPAIGGVLIKGEKGTAKSTAVRALADVLPPIDAVKIANSVGIRKNLGFSAVTVWNDRLRAKLLPPMKHA